MNTIATHFMASAALYMAEPSAFILAAYIQLTDARMSLTSEMRARARLVSDSPTASRAMAAGQIKPLMGCSPMEVAIPVLPCGSRFRMRYNDTK
jgi:hypothetical protein